MGILVGLTGGLRCRWVYRVNSRIFQPFNLLEVRFCENAGYSGVFWSRNAVANLNRRSEEGQSEDC